MRPARVGLPLIAILACAFVLPLGFGGRIINEDALGHHGAASNLLRGETTPHDLASVGYAFVAPIAVAQAAFGDTLRAARLVPLVYSLGSLVVVDALGMLHGGFPVAVAAAALLAIVPLDVIQTDLHADLALGFWTGLAVYAVMRAEATSRGRAAWLALGGLVGAVTLMAALGTWTVDRDNRFWNAVVYQAVPVIERYPAEAIVFTDISTAQVLRHLLPGRQSRIRDFEHGPLDASPPTRVLRDTPFVSDAIAKGRAVPPSVRVPPPDWRRIAAFPRDSRPSVRGLVLGLVGLTRPASTREAEPATLWLVSR